MYVPKPFQEDDPDRLMDAIRAYPFALLVSAGPEGPEATHLPVLPADGQPLRLVTHMARANPQWRAIEADPRVRVVFAGPHGYVSPRWYATAAQVPTWNYVAVHALGRARLVHDPAELEAMVAGLAAAFEGDGPDAWTLAHLPESVKQALLANIVGVEVAVERLVGSWKLNQNKRPADRAGVIEALAASPRAEDAALRAAMQAVPVD